MNNPTRRIAPKMKQYDSLQQRNVWLKFLVQRDDRGCPKYIFGSAQRKQFMSKNQKNFKPIARTIHTIHRLRQNTNPGSALCVLCACVSPWPKFVIGHSFVVFISSCLRV